jgi:hypothetical protein
MWTLTAQAPPQSGFDVRDGTGRLIAVTHDLEAARLIRVLPELVELLDRVVILGKDDPSIETDTQVLLGRIRQGVA